MRVTFYAVNVCSKVSVKSCTVKVTLGGAPDPGDRQSHDDVATGLALRGGEKQAHGDLGCAWVPQPASD